MQTGLGFPTALHADTWMYNTVQDSKQENVSVDDES